MKTYCQKICMIKRILFIICGLLSLLYYIICIAYAGIRLSFVWIWLLLSGFCFIRAFMITRSMQGKIKVQVPKWLVNTYRIILAFGIAVFALVESQGHKKVSGVPAKTLMPVGIHYVVREFFGFLKWKLL